MIIPVLAIVASLCLLMAFALAALIVLNGRQRCSLAAGRAIEDGLAKQRDEALERSAFNLERYESEAVARHEAREECGKARKELERVRASLRESVDSESQVRRDYEKASEEYTRASVASAQFLKERDAARKKQGAATAKCKRAVECAMKARKGKCDLIWQRDRAVADTTRATEELAGANSLLVAIRKENSRLMDERDEAHQDESKLQNSINHLATRHYSNSDGSKTGNG